MESEMSLVSTQPESLATAAGDLPAIGSDMAARNAAPAGAFHPLGTSPR
ncbi:PE domain-containing protein [Mycobacterium persicum]